MSLLTGNSNATKNKINKKREVSSFKTCHLFFLNKTYLSIGLIHNMPGLGVYYLHKTHDEAISLFTAFT
jgi:hypothetical protein